MKKLFLILSILAFTNYAFAQTDEQDFAFHRFKENYNQALYEEIFRSFSSEMKEALPLAKAKQFFTGLKSQLGDIIENEFKEYRQEGAALYKVQFKNGIRSILISINEHKEIGGLLIKSYVEKPENRVNVLHGYPKEIAEAIFNNSKYFPNGTQLSIAINRNKKTHFYGFIIESDTLKPINNQNKIFEIGSITKVFTSTVLASLVQEKNLKLNDEINEYFPYSFKDNRKINFKSLANHTSGLPRLPDNFMALNPANPYFSYGPKALEYYLKNQLTLKDSLTYEYSNLGAGLLGYTLELSQKIPLQDLYKRKIFDKYKMSQTFTSSEGLGNRLVRGLDEEGRITSGWDFDVLLGAGGILSTTGDLTKFAQAQLKRKNEVLKMTQKATFQISDGLSMGLGWHIRTDESLLWHNGGTGGYTSSMMINTDKKVSIAILSNVSAFHPQTGNIDELCFKLMQINLRK